MASTIDDRLDTSRKSAASVTEEGFGETYTLDLWKPMQTILKPLASIKLSVVLFAFAIAIILAGTFAQARSPLDDAIGTFFRIKPSELVQDGFPWVRLDRLFVWVPVNTFLVPSFGFTDPPLSNKLGVWLPKGWTVGLVMMINLIAAHLVRFRVQSHGARLAGGFGVMGLGALVTWLVVMSGSSANGLQETPLISYDTLWLLLQVGLFITALAALYAASVLKSMNVAERWILVGIGVLAAVICTLTIVSGRVAVFNDSGMRILYQLMEGTLAGLVLLAGAWLAFGKRAGIVVIHLGVGLIMASEVFVGLKAVESQMLIGEGESSNFLMDPSSVELAIIDHNHPDHPGEDVVTVIPQSMLGKGNVIDDERFPFTIEVDDFFANADIISPSANNPATQGIGAELEWRTTGRLVIGMEAKELPRAVGTEDRVDIPTAYITLRNREPDDEPLGSWLVCSLFDMPVSKERFPELSYPSQFVPLEDGENENRWEISLRHRRTYVPFEFTLHDIEVEHYVGTDTPKSYEALVSVRNTEDGFERDNIKIWMNNPLRYAGYTFYQSNYMADRSSQLEATTLQVVSNNGWLVPYLACMIVAVGLTWQFGTSLVRFIGRRSRMAASAAGAADTESHLTRSERRRQEREQAEMSAGTGRAAFESVFPWIMGMAAIGYLLVVVNLASVHRPGPGEFNTALFGRLPVMEGGRIKPIDSQARNALMTVSDIQTFELHGAKGSYSESRSAAQWILETMTNSPVYHSAQVVRIENDELLADLGLEHRSGLRYAIDELDQQRLEALEEEFAELGEVENSAELTAYQRALRDMSRRMTALGDSPENFVKGQQALGDNEYLSLLSEALAAYDKGEAQTFNRTVAQLHRRAGQLDLKDYNPWKVGFEAFYNGIAPFFHAWVLSIMAFALVAGSWLGWSEPLRKSANIIMWMAFGVITFAIIARIYISGRPPVTNLYSSAVFIAWVGVLFGLIFERIYRNSMGLAVSGLVGMLTLKVAHVLAMDGDTFTVLQAVLDTQFWLATHVVTITAGYATTYVAGLFGLMYLLSGLAAELFPDRVSPAQVNELKKNLVRMMYGTLCFALLFSFVGTVLGGLWADDSWGRFWGWDPKENGALIIVLWNALVLHARWDRIVRDKGLAALCVLGNITVSWSWFGTNALQIGLHSYGFKEGVLFWLSVFMLSQIVVAGLALIPDRSQSGTPTAGA